MAQNKNLTSNTYIETETTLRILGRIPKPDLWKRDQIVLATTRNSPQHRQAIHQDLKNKTRRKLNLYIC